DSTKKIHAAHIPFVFPHPSGASVRPCEKLAAVWHRCRASRNPVENTRASRVEIRPDRKKRRYRYSPIVKHSMMHAVNKTSISLEYPFWDGLRVIAQNENIPVATLVERIDTDRVGNNLSSFCAELFQNAKSNLVV